MSSNHSDLVILNVCGRLFSTRRSTLENSDWFSTRIGDGFHADRLPDGSYFIDGDAEVFEHILNYLRGAGENYPLFWTKENGFDLTLYMRVANMADMYSLHQLRDWILESEFREAVQTRTVTEAQTIWADYDQGRWEKSGGGLKLVGWDFEHKNIKLFAESSSARKPNRVLVHSHWGDPGDLRRFKCPMDVPIHARPEDCYDTQCYGLYVCNMERRDEVPLPLEDFWQKCSGILTNVYEETLINLEACKKVHTENSPHG